MIVEADADLDDAAAQAGRERVLLRRPELHLGAADLRPARCLRRPARSASCPQVEALVVGDPADEATDVGPLIDRDERDRVLAWIEEARAAGAEILTGGDARRRAAPPDGDRERAGPDAKVSCEEVFGPVCTVTAYDTLDEAIELANGTRFGLQAGIFTSNVKTALAPAQRLEFGGVTVNEAPTFRADQMPYGGVKDSGNTREGPAYAVREMTEERLVVLAL